MGWITHEQQAYVKRQYKRGAQYICDADFCGEPIFHGELPVVDPKGGYFPKPPNSPDFVPREPKVTYHQRCDLQLRGKHVPYKVVPASTAESQAAEKAAKKQNSKGENTMATKAKKSSKEEVVSKKKVAATTEKKSTKKTNGSAVMYFGKFRSTGGSGGVVECFMQTPGKAVKDADLKKAAGGAALPGRLSPIAAWGKKSGYYTIMKSKKVPNAHVMIVKKPNAYIPKN